MSDASRCSASRCRFGPASTPRDAWSSSSAPSRVLLPIRAGLRRPARPAASRCRRVRPRRARGARRGGDPRRAATGAPRVAAGALILSKFRSRYRSDQPAIRRPTSGRGSRRCRPAIAAGRGAPPVYRFVAQLPAPAVDSRAAARRAGVRHPLHVLLDPPLEPLVNGYSGGAPGDTRCWHQAEGCRHATDRAWRALVDSTATHAIVHGVLLRGRAGPRISDWIRERGGREIGEFGSDRSLCSTWFLPPASASGHILRTHAE